MCEYMLYESMTVPGWILEAGSVAPLASSMLALPYTEHCTPYSPVVHFAQFKETALVTEDGVLVGVLVTAPVIGLV